MLNSETSTSVYKMLHRPQRRCFDRPRRFAWLGMAGALAIAISARGPVSGAPLSVDTSDALIVGPHKLSVYRVEKNFQRFITSAEQFGANRPKHEMAGVWFPGFLVDQVLTAQALEDGYGERSEVTSEVRRMERHMLTQFAGPFYECLYSAESDSLPSLGSSSLCRQSSFDVEIVRAPSSAPIARQIGEMLAQAASGEHDLDLATIAASGQAECYVGSIEWPFEPFAEIAGAIGRASIDRWQTLEAGDALVAFRVRGKRPFVMLFADRARSPSSELVQQQRIQKERRQRVLREAEFMFDWPAAHRWVDEIRAQRPDPLLPLDTESVRDMLSVELASYCGGQTREVVTVAEYIAHFNDLYVRSLPCRPLDVYHEVQSMVVAREDCDEARRLGIDREPKFEEDRRNYRDLLALDLFVKERIRPALGVDESDIEKYYNANVSAFTRPTRVDGAIVTFTEVADAVAYAEAVGRDGFSVLSTHAESRRPLTLTPITELSEFDFLPRLVFASQVPRVLGPFPTADGFAVWECERVTDSEVLPLESVSQEIRSKLEEPLLGQYKAEVARRLSPRFPIEDKIAYGKYGFDGVIAKPWTLR